MTTMTRKQINAFLQHLHYIPGTRGWTKEWMAINVPGWTTQGLMEALKDAGAVEKTTEHFTGWRACVNKVTLQQPSLPADVVIKGTVDVHEKD